MRFSTATAATAQVFAQSLGAVVSELQAGERGLVIAAQRRAQTLVHPTEKGDLEGAALRPDGQGIALDNQVGPQPARGIVAQPGIGTGKALVERLLALLRPLDHRAAMAIVAG